MSEQNEMNSVQMAGGPPVVSPQVIAEADLIGRLVADKSSGAATGPNFSSMAMAATSTAPKLEMADLPQGEVARITAIAVDHMDRVDGLSEIREAARVGSLCSIAEGKSAPAKRGRRVKLVASLVACAAIASGMIGLSAYRITHPDTSAMMTTPKPPTPDVPTTQLSLNDSSADTSSMAALNAMPMEVAKPAAAVPMAAIAAKAPITPKVSAASPKTTVVATNVKQFLAPAAIVASAPAAANVKPIVSSNIPAATVAKAALPDAPKPHMFIAPKALNLTLANSQPADYKGNFTTTAVASVPVPQQNMKFVPPTAIHVALAPTQPAEIRSTFTMAGTTTNVATPSQAMTFIAPKPFVAPKPTNLALATAQSVEVGGGFATPAALVAAPKHEQAITFVAPKTNLALLPNPASEPALTSKATLVTTAYTPARSMTHVAGLNLKLMTVSAKSQPTGWIAPLPMDSVSEHRQFLAHVVSVSNSFGSMTGSNRPASTSKVVASEQTALMQAVPMSVAASVAHGSVSSVSVPTTVTANADRKVVTGKVVSQPAMAEAVPAAKSAEVTDRPAVTSTMISIPVAAEASPKTVSGRVVNEPSLAEAVPAAKSSQVADRPAVTSTQIGVPVAAESGLKSAATNRVVTTGGFTGDVSAAKSSNSGAPSNGRVMSTPSLSEAVPAAKVERTDTPRNDVRTDVMSSPVTGITEHAAPKGNVSNTPVFNQQSGQAMIKAPQGQVQSLNMPAVIGGGE
jgi:hypothetical protein